MSAYPDGRQAMQIDSCPTVARLIAALRWPALAALGIALSILPAFLYAAFRLKNRDLYGSLVVGGGLMSVTSLYWALQSAKHSWPARVAILLSVLGLLISLNAPRINVVLLRLLTGRAEIEIKIVPTDSISSTG